MTSRWFALPLICALAGCGADGAPERPTEKERRVEPGVSITGTVSVGVVGGNTRIDYGGN